MPPTDSILREARSPVASGERRREGSVVPTYQYRCRKCGEEFEKHQSFTDESTPRCPGCGTRSKANVAKVFGAVGISFKGSGFYKNDHGRAASSSSKSDGGSSDSGSSSSEGSKSKTSSESKSSTSSD